MLLPQSSLTEYVLVTIYGFCTVPAPPLFWSPTKATIGFALQLSCSLVTTVMLAAGISLIHLTLTAVGLLAVGLVLSSFLNVAGEAPHGLVVPAVLLPQSAASMYLTLMLYPLQFSTVCVLLAPQLFPLS